MKKHTGIPRPRCCTDTNSKYRDYNCPTCGTSAHAINNGTAYNGDKHAPRCPTCGTIQRTPLTFTTRRARFSAT